MTIYGNEQIDTNCSDHDCNICAGSSSLQSIFGVQITFFEKKVTLSLE
jgi:hypothetical protein